MRNCRLSIPIACHTHMTESQNTTNVHCMKIAIDRHTYQAERLDERLSLNKMLR